MTKVLAGITTSVDGYVAGPDDRPGQGLGEGGERLHYWVFGGPWTYDNEPEGGASGEDVSPRRGIALAGLPGASADHRLEFRCLSHDVRSFFKSLGLQAPASKSSAEEKHVADSPEVW